MTLTTNPPEVQRSKDAARHSAVIDPWAPVVPLALDRITRNPRNPRKRFDKAALAELAESLKVHGLLEPVIVRPLADDTYELIAGERRWRAAPLAGLTELAARVVDGIDDRAALELALVENLQRQDLDPIEEAEGYRALHDVVGLKQAEIAAAVKRGQPAIAKALGLLDLPEDVRELIRTRALTPAHGAALLRFRAFPAVCSAIAQWAVEAHTTSKDLEKDPFDSYGLRAQLIEKGLVHAFGYREPNYEMCASCPWGALWSTDYDRYCLKPAHARELWRAYEQEEKERLQAAIADAQKAGTTLPKLDKLKYGTYEHIFPSSCPPDCTESCPCRGQALDYENKVVPICTDPKRYQSLKAAQTREQNRQAKERYEQEMAALGAHLGAQTELDRRGLALLVAEALRGSGGSRTSVAKALIAAEGLDLNPKKLTEWSLDFAQVEKLAALEPAALVRLAVGIILGSELKDNTASTALTAAMTSRVNSRHEWYMAPVALAQRVRAGGPNAPSVPTAPADTAAGLAVAGGSVGDA